MRDEKSSIYNEKIVLKGAQSIWAMNKYFVMACSQKHYHLIRQYLKSEKLNLPLVYEQIKDINQTFQSVPTKDLPELSNALYHMAGYFKKLLPNDKRQSLHHLVINNQSVALAKLEDYTSYYNIQYLKQSNIWQKKRALPFNQVNTTLTYEGRDYLPGELFWQGEYILVRQANY